MKKIGIFVDLDGTLMTSDKKISDFDKEMISKVRKLGHKVYIVTGKSLINSIDYYNELNLDTLIVTSQGQVLSKPNDHDFKQIVHPINSEDAKKIFAELTKQFNTKNFLVETSCDKLFVQKDEPSNLINLISDGRKPFVYDNSNIEDIIGCYVEVDYVSEEYLHIGCLNLNNEWAGKFEFAFWMTEGNYPIIQIKPGHVGKGIAMKEVMKLDKLNYSISFGNGWSDRNMLSKADEGYAMKNSADKIKSFAKHVTEFDNNNSGVGKELQKIFKL